MNEISIRELEKAASFYQELMVPALFEKYANQIVDEAKIKSSDNVLDVACGTGVVTRVAAQRLNREEFATGLDMNPGMISEAKRQAPDIEWRQGIAESLDWVDDFFDVILSQFGLMFFEDRSLALREMKRVLKPGGRMVISVFDSLDNIKPYKRMTEIFNRIVGVEVGQALSFPFSLGDVDKLKSICNESGLSSARISRREVKANFPDVRTMVLADVKGWFPLAGFVLDDDQLEKVIKEAESALRDFVSADGSVTFPLPAYFITFTKN